MSEKRFPKECEGLGCLRTDHFTIGIVEGINNGSAALVEDFEVTKHEAALLAERYLQDLYGTLQFCTFYQQGGSSEARTMAFAHRRLDTLQKVLGEEAWEKALGSKIVREKAKLAIIVTMNEAVDLDPQFHEELWEKHEAIQERFLPELESKWSADDKAAWDETIARVRKVWLDEARRLAENCR
jgi:hypothetical protein